MDNLKNPWSQGVLNQAESVLLVNLFYSKPIHESADSSDSVGQVERISLATPIAIVNM